MAFDSAVNPQILRLAAEVDLELQNLPAYQAARAQAIRLLGRARRLDQEQLTRMALAGAVLANSLLKRRREVAGG